VPREPLILSVYFLSLGVFSSMFIISSSSVEVKSTGVPVKGNHVEGLCQLSLERATAVEDEWVACLIQDRVIAKVL
jgi:hypothetical protein